MRHLSIVATLVGLFACVAVPANAKLALVACSSESGKGSGLTVDIDLSGGVVFVARFQGDIVSHDPPEKAQITDRSVSWPASDPAYRLDRKTGLLVDLKNPDAPMKCRPTDDL